MAWTFSAKRRHEICHMFISPLMGESRLYKELATAAKMHPADSLLTIGLDDDKPEPSVLAEGGYPYERIRLWSRRLPRGLPFQLIKYLEWTLRAAARVRASKAEILHCHSLPALPAAVLSSILLRSPIVYDAHEFETERANMGGYRRRAAALLERMLMPFVSEILVVSPAIGQHYRNTYAGKLVSLLMNMPSHQVRSPGIDLRNAFGLGANETLVIYVGALGPMRGIELLIKAFENMPPDRHCVFMGSGPYEEMVREIAAKNRQIHFHPAVPEADILGTVGRADLSFCVIDCTAASYRYALPNKFFQSLMAGVPVLVNEENVEMLASGAETDMVFAVPYEADAIRDFIADFSASHGKREKQEFSWEAQEEVLLTLYRRLYRAPAEGAKAAE